MAAPHPPEGVAARDTEAIWTPDRRLRVFVSSTLEELAEERRAVRDAVTRLRLTPVMFELGARPHPPRDLYRAYLDRSDVFVGIYGERYGWVAPGMAVSGLEDEYDLSAGKPRLLYLRRSTPDREPRLTALVERMQAEGGASTTPYGDAAQLGDLVADDLAVLLTERFAARTPAPPGLAAGWLPAPDAPLVDRADDLALLTGLLREPGVRLVTVSGPGGTGKTRLALAAAQAAVPDRDAVWWVELAVVRDAADVPAAVAAAVGVVPEGSAPVLELVADRLAGRRVLLVLDNAEHVPAAAPGLGRLLAACPGTQLLVTSRVLLGLRGEHDVPLGPLAVPPAGETDVAAVGAAPAVELFTARARRADPAFAVTTATARPVAELVRRLDGLPLALELVAARVRVLPPELLLRRLGEALQPALDLPVPGVDVPARQRTLRATIAWSHELLAEPARLLLARLSVCAGGCTLDTAEALGALDRDLDVVDALSTLVAHSLVAPSGADGEPRFRMLELVRSFAGEQLRGRGEEDRTRQRLAEHLAGLSATAGARLAGPDHRTWLRRLDDERLDLEASMRWAVTADRADLVVALAAPLARWSWSRGLLPQMAEIADATAALPSAASLPFDAEGLLTWARGATRISLGRSAEAAALLTDLLARARERDHPWLLGHALAALAISGVPGAAERGELLTEAVAVLRRAADDWSVAFALVPLGNVALLDGDLTAATRAHREALDLARRIGDPHLAATVLDQLGLDALLAGDLAEARAHLLAAAAGHREVRDQEGLANCLALLAGLALALGDAPAAARLAGASEAARAVLGLTVWPLLQPLAEQFAGALTGALGADRDRAERAAGARAGPWVTLDRSLRDLATVDAAPA